jgi:hypothetical protein
MRIFGANIRPGVTFSTSIVLHWLSLLNSTEVNTLCVEFAIANATIG